MQRVRCKFWLERFDWFTIQSFAQEREEHANPHDDYPQSKLGVVGSMNDKLQTLMFLAVSRPRLSWALLILRLFVGVAFIQHGSGKLMHPSAFAAEFGIPVWLGLATMLTQFIGGILLILGTLTPLAALGIAGTMIPATIFLIQRGEPFINPAGHSWENAAFYPMAGVCLALSGAGRWSVDARLFGRAVRK
jgi:putative oxidoreductase